MKKSVDVLIIIFVIGVMVGSVLSVFLGIEHELNFESNSYIIAVKAFVSAFALLLIVTKINRSLPYLVGFIFLLGLINGYIFLMLLSVYSFFETFYRTILYLVLLYTIILFGCTHSKRRKDNRIFLILLVSVIYGLLSYFLY